MPTATRYVPIVITDYTRRAALEYFKTHIKFVGECWLWTGQIEKEGYGRLHWPLADPNVKVQAHRFSWVLFNGPIPDDLEPDHKCRNRACVNYNHLELVTTQVNVLRGIGPTAINAKKTHCPKGHPLKGDNLVPWVEGRECHTCHKEYMRTYQRLWRERLVAKRA